MNLIYNSQLSLVIFVIIITTINIILCSKNLYVLKNHWCGVRFFSKLAVEACERVRLEKEGRFKCPIGNIHILKSHGQSALESELVDGFALNCSRASPAMPSSLKGDVKVALLDFNLQKHKMQMGVQVVVTDTKQVEEIRQREMDITKEKIQRILNAGAKVVLTTKGIDDLCLKYFIEAGAIAVRRVTEEDMKRIAKATGGQLVSHGRHGGRGGLDPASLGTCAVNVSEMVIYYTSVAARSACTVVLRGANEFMLDEMDRALHDSLCVIKRIIESNSLVAGGGSVEFAFNLSGVCCLQNDLQGAAGRSSLGALLVIPRTLTVNAAHDATELVAVSEFTITTLRRCLISKVRSTTA